MSELIYVYDTRTGKRREHPVPRKWLGHPIYGRHISETLPAPAEETPIITDPPVAGETPEED